MLVVISIIGVFVAWGLSRFFGGSDSGAGERNLQSVTETIKQKRDEAVRLNGNRMQTSLESEVAPILTVDFDDFSTTASLVVSGLDEDRDNYDDETRTLLTHVERGNWVYSYRNDEIKMIGNWKVVTNPGELDTGPITDSGQGDLVTKIGFDGDGRAYGWQNDAWQKFPINLDQKKDSHDDSFSSFWAIYLVNESNKNSAIAIAVYPSGQTEKFRYDGTSWLGFRSRNIQK